MSRSCICSTLSADNGCLVPASASLSFAALRLGVSKFLCDSFVIALALVALGAYHGLSTFSSNKSNGGIAVQRAQGSKHDTGKNPSNFSWSL